MGKTIRAWLLAIGAALGPVAGALADEVRVAVAANFTAPAQRIAADFERSTGHKLLLSIGSTGKFTAQIRNGAPYEVLLSADSETPERLQAEHLAVAGTRITYAIGKLVLWSPRPGVVDANGNVLRTGHFSHLAIADPALAPYGAAAVQTMRALGLYDRLHDRIVQGENIGQAFQFVASGNAELGFVALSQIENDGRLRGGSSWLVPGSMYSTLSQDAVLLEPGRDSAAAKEFLDWLVESGAREVIRAYGYELPAGAK